MLAPKEEGEEFARILLSTILEKRMRYYHGLIDTQFLSSGTDYGALPNVVIVVILPYDPFGKNRMVYTIKNSCAEDPTVPYDDGTRKIFLYTKGKEGNPSQKLSDMLKYIEKTTNNNVTGSPTAASGGGTLAAVAKCTCRHVHLARCSQESRH